MAGASLNIVILPVGNWLGSLFAMVVEVPSSDTADSNVYWKVFFNFLLVSRSLTSHWPKQALWPVPALGVVLLYDGRSCKPLQLQNKSTMWVDTLRLILLSSPHKKTVPIDSPRVKQVLLSHKYV